jgi:hypothetical protein
VATGIKNQAPNSAYFYEFGDDAGEEQFLMFHHLRHHTYDLIESRKGVTLPPLDLKGPIDKDWLLRHSTRHKTYRKIDQLIPGNSVVGLNTVSWDSRSSHTDWLRIHALDHANLDQYFGLS